MTPTDDKQPAPPLAGDWIEWHGGENPVPGQMVETRSKFDTHDGPELSDRKNWLNNYNFGQIIAYRLAASAPKPCIICNGSGEQTGPRRTCGACSGSGLGPTG